ncbi:hypothetical protein C1646_669540 [Rhizophagus diaphanus]|nr:hypothetical protein C1646_669540 [Rhizophagus diaphanus] [Rhizophagus sp. MUCL 43196]
MNTVEIHITKNVFMVLIAYLHDKLVKISATLTIKNKHQNLILTEPKIFSPGEVKNPPDTVINPGEISDSTEFTAGSGQDSRGIISYKIIKQREPNSNPLYLMVTWKVKLSGENSLNINVREYGQFPSLDKSLLKELHRGSTCPNITVKYHDNRHDFIVTGIIDNKSNAKIKITLSQNFQNTGMTEPTEVPDT